MALIPSAAYRIAVYLVNIPTLAFDVPYAPPTRSPANPAIDDVPRSLDGRRRVGVEGPSGDQSVEAPADRREVLPDGGCGDHIAIPTIHLRPGHSMRLAYAHRRQNSSPSACWGSTARIGERT